MNEAPLPGRVLYLFVIVFAIITTLTAVVRWFLIDNPDLLPPAAAHSIQSRTLTSEYRLAGFVIEMIRLEAALYALLALYGICDAYLRGEALGPTVGALYRKFGLGLVMLAAVNAAYTTALAAVFSWLSGATVSIRPGIGASDLYLFGIGIAVLMLSLAIDEARGANKENEESDA